MYEYMSSPLYSADKDIYYQVTAEIKNEIKGEMIAYNKFFEKYKNSTASQISGVINDTYLQSQGTEGTKSYGMVVDLAVAYLKEHLS